MKKIGTLVLTFILLVFSTIFISGCNNEGFELVKSVSITTSGEEKVFNSTTTPQVLFEIPIDISYGEFNAASDNRKFYGVQGWEPNALSKITIKDAISAAKNSTHYEVVEKDLEGYWYRAFSYTTHGKVYYSKYKYKKTLCNFVYVKVKDDTTLVIRNGDGDTTYTVSSYRIVFW